MASVGLLRAWCPAGATKLTLRCAAGRRRWLRTAIPEPACAKVWTELLCCPGNKLNAPAIEAPWCCLVWLMWQRIRHCKDWVYTGVIECRGYQTSMTLLVKQAFAQTCAGAGVSQA